MHKIIFELNFSSIKFIEVGVGSNAIENQTIHELEEAFIYPSYTPLTTIDDIALLKLKKPVTFSDSVQPILFPFPNRTDNLPVIAMGWGRTVSWKVDCDTCLPTKHYF